MKLPPEYEDWDSLGYDPNNDGPSGKVIIGILFIVAGFLGWLLLR